MFGKHHRLAEEFPNFKDKINELTLNDSGFSGLLKTYSELDDEIFRIEEDIETPSDEYTESLKFKRVQLKDKLYAILRGT